MEEEERIMTLVTAYRDERGNRENVAVLHRPDPDMPMVFNLPDNQELVILSHEILMMARRLRIERRKKKVKIWFERLMELWL